MTLDELAAAIVGTEPDDLRELARIHDGLQSLSNSTQIPQDGVPLLNEATTSIERIILADCDDPLALIERIAQLIAAVQRLTEHVELNGDAASPEMQAAVQEALATAVPIPATPAEPAAASKTRHPMSAADLLGSDPALLAEFVTESIDHLERAEASLLELETRPDDMELVNGIFRAFHTIKGTSGFLGLQRINSVAHKAETLLDQARQGQVQLAGPYADVALESTDMLKKLVEQVRHRLEGAPSPEPAGVDALLARLDAPADAGPREPQASAAASPATAQSREASEIDKASDAASSASARAGLAAASTDATLRVSMTRLDKLIDMVGELVIAQSMIGQDDVIKQSRSPVLARKVSHAGKITRELQDLTLSMRMVPLKGTFQKMARLVRDVARKNGKNVHFVTEGEDTEIDRNMVDSINDPLVHMMRNAVDHGIEPPAERQAAGKPVQGTVTLRAYHAAGKVVIEIQDDGRGIDPDKVLAKAVERGIVEPGRELTKSEIYELLFAPGFSTAEKVTDVSGRGVGMDVVKRNIEGMRGQVDVVSEKGKGSTFTIRLPLTLAIIDGMLIQVGQETYVLPTLNIEHAFRPDKESLSSVVGKGEMVMLRGNLIPVFRLHRLFDVRGATEDATQGLLVVVEHEGQRCALLADGLLGQQQVVIKSLGTVLGEIEGVSGAAILGDGRVGLILDVGGVIRVALGGESKEAA